MADGSAPSTRHEEVDPLSTPGLAFQSDFSLVLHYDPMLVAELALGADPPYAIAERYGLTPDDYDHLDAQDWFQRLVAQKRHEFHDTGVLFTAKAAMMAEALLTRLFQQSMVGSIAPPLTVEVAKQLTDIGRLKPQPANTQAATPNGGFQINIQVNGSDVVASRLVPGPSQNLEQTVAPVRPDTNAGAAAPPVSPQMSAGGASRFPPEPVATPYSRATGVPAPSPAPPSGAAMSLEFPAPKGTPPAFISNLRVPDFDVRPDASLVNRPSAPAGQPAAPGLPSAPIIRP